MRWLTRVAMSAMAWDRAPSSAAAGTGVTNCSSPWASLSTSRVMPLTARLTVKITLSPMMVLTPKNRARAKPRVLCISWSRRASRPARLRSTSSTPNTFCPGGWAWQAGAGAAGLVVDGQDGAQHPVAAGAGEDAVAVLLGQAGEGGVLGVAGKAGLGLLVHHGPHLGLVGGEDHPALGVHDAHPLHPRLLAHVGDGLVEVAPLAGHHGQEGDPAQGVGEGRPVGHHGLGELLAVLVDVEKGGQAHGQEDDHPHGEGELEAERTPGAADDAPQASPGLSRPPRQTPPLPRPPAGGQAFIVARQGRRGQGVG